MHLTLAPISLTNCLRPMDCGRHYYTRAVANKDLLVPRPKIGMYKFSYRGSSLWKSLSLHITESPSPFIFKSSLKAYIYFNQGTPQLFGQLFYFYQCFVFAMIESEFALWICFMNNKNITRL